MALEALFSKWRHSPSRHASFLETIHSQRKELQKLSDKSLQTTFRELQFLAQTGTPLSKLLAKTYAIVQVAAKRTLSMSHYDVQLLGGIALFERSVVQMQTGEGKTLTATLPLILASLAKRGAHLATANDYLARRDAELLSPLYQFLGLSVGLITAQTPPSLRHKEYRADIIYTTAKELGFDFLRDRLNQRSQTTWQTRSSGISDLFGNSSTPSLWQKEEADLATSHTQATSLQPELYFALIDEADSLLLDESKTPLVISQPGTLEVPEELYHWAQETSSHLLPEEDYHFPHEKHFPQLSPSGRQKIRRTLKPPSLAPLSQQTIFDHVTLALRANLFFHPGQQYILEKGEVTIVDANTGRLATGKKWQGGLHQAVEAKEGLPISANNIDAAKILLQTFFNRYKHLSGMTGTTQSGAAELKKVYGLKTSVIPDRLPKRRKEFPPKVLGTQEAKWRAVLKEILAIHNTGRPILIGTCNIDHSQLLADRIRKKGLIVELLNAVDDRHEAQIISRAGQARAITVATNMAGRGTDIRLGEGISERGGLHVLLTEMHNSARIDRQLVGRSARQGDRGSFRIFVALDDEHPLSSLNEEKIKHLKSIGKNSPDRNHSHLFQHFQRAQRRKEKAEARQRTLLLYHEKQRIALAEEMGQDPFLDGLT
ncbi:MAG: preprotein translocase subunit SecA [Pirellulaceae bacterium]|nr:preprotein translocase subunit SecA [Pirellulaceae bacterium]